VEGLVQREELYEAAADKIVQATFRKALEQEAITPDASVRPIVELSKIDRETSVVEYSAKVPLPPQVMIGDYKGLPLNRPPIEISDEEVESQLEEMRKRRQTREAVTDRGVETGDVAVVNIKIDGDSGDGRNFMTIAGQNFPQLDEAILGMKVEDMKHMELSFPEDFQEKDWAGQTHSGQVTINSLSSVRLPPLDDTFAQSLQTDSVEDLRNRIVAALKNAKQQMVKDLINDQLLERLQERSTVYVSDNMWEALAAQRMEQAAAEQEKAGKTLEQYAAENGMTLEQFDEAWKSKAKMHIERALLIRDVFTKEQMQLTNEELNSELYVMAGEYEVEAEQMFNMLRENDALDELHFRAISHKVSHFLEENAAEAGPALALNA
jgi:trigger factor